MIKKILKNKSSIILTVLIVAAFSALHYYIYLNTQYEIPLVSTTQTPIEMKALTLCETNFPDYFNPFQKPTYTYCLNDGSKKISEEAMSFFSYSKMRPLSEKISDYWQGEKKEGKMFMRSAAVQDYPNTIFFLVQYALIAAFIFILFKLVRSK